MSVVIINGNDYTNNIDNCKDDNIDNNNNKIQIIMTVIMMKRITKTDMSERRHFKIQKTAKVLQDEKRPYEEQDKN